MSRLFHIIFFAPLFVFFIVPPLSAYEGNQNADVSSITSVEIDALPESNLDSTTVELFTNAVGELHQTASTLAIKLSRIENRMKLLKAENRYLRTEVEKSIKRKSAQAKRVKAEARILPLDKEVMEANMILENLASKLSALAWN